MNVTFFDTHPRTKLIYYTLAFFTSIIVWIAAIFSISASSYVLIIGTGGNAVLMLGLGIVSLLPLSLLMTMFAYNGIKKRGDRMVSAYKSEWSEFRKRRAEKIKK